MDDLLVCHLGRVEYRAAVELQQALRARVQAGELGDLLLLLEHPPVYTLGRRATAADLPMGEAWYRAQGIDVVESDRGGKLTYHGPGQLVGYPIMRVDDVVGQVRAIERAIVAALGEEGVARARATTRGSSSPACGRASARSPRSASTSSAASARTASRSTSTTTCSRSSGSCRAGCRRCG